MSSCRETKAKVSKKKFYDISEGEFQLNFFYVESHLDLAVSVFMAFPWIHSLLHSGNCICIIWSNFFLSYSFSYMTLFCYMLAEILTCEIVHNVRIEQFCNITKMNLQHGILLYDFCTELIDSFYIAFEHWPFQSTTTRTMWL